MSTEDLAQRIWNNAGPLKGPVVEAYYGWRGLAVPKIDNLRFAPSLRHKSGVNYPAIIARAENVKGDLTGVQRTFLAHDGSGKAPVDKKLQKMSFGVIRGSLVRLADPVDPLLIGEGVETVLTVMQATAYAGAATLGTAGLSATSLPHDTKDIILLGENDGGKNARAVAKIAPELKRKGIRVRVAMPIEGFKDHNAMVMEASAADRAAAFEAVRKTVEEAQDFADPLDDLVERAKTDPGAPFELEILAKIKSCVAGIRRPSCASSIFLAKPVGAALPNLSDLQKTGWTMATTSLRPRFSSISRRLREMIFFIPISMTGSLMWRSENTVRRLKSDRNVSAFDCGEVLPNDGRGP